MTLNSSFYYARQALHVDHIPISDIVAQVGTPVYVYSLKRTLENFRRIQLAFASMDAHIHYSAKANGNLTILRTLIGAGAGIDAVSAGEIHKALKAGVNPEEIVFAGVGKTLSEIRYAVEHGVGWFNIENIAECQFINDAAKSFGRSKIRVALRLNPEVTANTHPYIATGHGGAKFGLTAETIAQMLLKQGDYPYLNFAGIHLHIGSQLGDTAATQKAVQVALDLIHPYPNIRVVNVGGGLPVAYRPNQSIPTLEAFAQTLKPLLEGYTVLLEPGRSIIADAGIFVSSVLYIKKQAGQIYIITDGSMAELIRPALYQAHHEIVPLRRLSQETHPTNVVGPVCETADVLGRDVMLPEVKTGDMLAVLTAGAYGMAMASNYNARPMPPEIVVHEDGETWSVARHRQSWDDLLAKEI